MLEATAELLCVGFWYAASVSSASASSLVVRRQFDNGTMGDLWRAELRGLATTGRPRWSAGQVAVPGLDSESRLFIEGNSDSGGFAVDDIKVSLVSTAGFASCQQSHSSPHFRSPPSPHWTSARHGPATARAHNYST